MAALFALLLVGCESASFDGIAFEGASYVYDGTEKSIAVTGLPEGASVTYEGTNAFTDAGSYPVKANVTLADGSTLLLTATLTIQKATYNMSGVSFKSRSFTQDGTACELSVSGELPEGVSVRYSGNGEKNVGVYLVTASFTGDSNNYEPIPSMYAAYAIFASGQEPVFYHTVTFHSDGGTPVAPQSVERGTTLTAPATPTRSGYAFLGWYDGDTLWDLDTQPVMSDMTLTARWELSDLITVTFDSNGGTPVASQSVQKGTLLTAPADPERPGYTFTGWKADYYSWNFDRDPVSQSRTLTASWTADYCMISVDGGIGLTEYVGNKTDVVIPESIDGNTVVAIGDANYNRPMFDNGSSVKSVRLPSTLKRIRDRAFSGCSSLTELTVPEGVAEIGVSAFSGCSSLAELSLPSTLISLGSNALSGCTSLSYTVQDNCRYLGNSQTPYFVLVKVLNDSVTSLTLRGDTKIVYQKAFSDCKKLVSISLPQGLVAIGASAFADCAALQSITIPEGVTRIEAEAFKNCTALASVSLPEGLKTIGQNAFYGAGITVLDLPDSVTEIEYGAFGYCEQLTAIHISRESKLTTIGSNAFSSLRTPMETLFIPAGVTTIYMNAFSTYRSGMKIDRLIIDKGTELSSVSDWAFDGMEIGEVFFGGTMSDWADAYIGNYNDMFKGADRYYYSEEEPTDEGNYWHYSAAGDAVKW